MGIREMRKQSETVFMILSFLLGWYRVRTVAQLHVNCMKCIYTYIGRGKGTHIAVRLNACVRIDAREQRDEKERGGTVVDDSSQEKTNKIAKEGWEKGSEIRLHLLHSPSCHMSPTLLYYTTNRVMHPRDKTPAGSMEGF